MIKYDKGKPERLKSLTPDIKLPEKTEKTIEGILYTMEDYGWIENKIVPSIGRNGVSYMSVIINEGIRVFELI